jgi:putative lipoic acid-binding regulatory protein
MNEEKKEQLKKQLEEFHVWPSIYMYKFIFPTNDDTMAQLKRKFPEEVEYTIKKSSGGKYSSVTIKEMVLKAEIIFERYEDVSSIDGIIAI